MKKAIILTVLVVLGSMPSFIAAQQPGPPPPGGYVPGFNIFGVLYLFVMFVVGVLIIYMLPNLRDLFKGGL